MLKDENKIRETSYDDNNLDPDERYGTWPWAVTMEMETSECFQGIWLSG